MSRIVVILQLVNRIGMYRFIPTYYQQPSSENGKIRVNLENNSFDDRFNTTFNLAFGLKKKHFFIRKGTYMPHLKPCTGLQRRRGLGKGKGEDVSVDRYRLGRSPYEFKEQFEFMNI